MIKQLLPYLILSFLLHVIFFFSVTFKGQHPQKTLPIKSTLTLRSSRPKSNKPMNKPSPPQPSAKQKPRPPKVKKIIKSDVQPTPPTASPTPSLMQQTDQNSTAPSETTTNNLNEEFSGGAEGQSGSSQGTTENLQQEAALDTNTLQKPEYTKEALRARVQGIFAVDIHVSETGKALEVELIQSPGFGMDERITAVLLSAKYFPKRDASGKTLDTWITIQFKLEM